MVLKLRHHLGVPVPPFENDVKTYGTQTNFLIDDDVPAFENDVKTYGTQTIEYKAALKGMFENDVKRMVLKPSAAPQYSHTRLRMM